MRQRHWTCQTNKIARCADFRVASGKNKMSGRRRKRKKKGNEPIKSRESHASVSKQKTSVANKLFKASDQLSDRIMQTTASEIVDKINNLYLPANYEADKML